MVTHGFRNQTNVPAKNRNCNAKGCFSLSRRQPNDTIRLSVGSARQHDEQSGRRIGGEPTHLKHCFTSEPLTPSIVKVVL